MDADFSSFGRDARPAVGMADWNGGDPDIVLGHVSAVVAGAVAFAESLRVNDAGLEADGGTQIKNVGVAKFVFGVDAVDGHAGANHIEESVGMLKKTETGGGVLFAESNAFFFK